MELIAAVDLKNGKVVRLLQGRYEEVTVYSHDPIEIAKAWERYGADRIHVVDLDGAFSGRSKNIPVIKEIVENVNIPMQFGGGLRSREDIAQVINIGAKWAILGTKACEDSDFVKQVINEFGEKIIVSIDVKFKKVAHQGWTKTSEIDDVDLIKKMQEIGVKSFIYTDISRDGTLRGVDISGVKRVLEETGASLFYSGGISTMEDIKNLKPLEKQGLAGIIIGKALYESKIHIGQIKKFMEKRK